VTTGRRLGVGLIATGVACGVVAVLPAVHAVADSEPGSGLGSFGLNAFATGAQLRVGEPSYCFTSTAAKNGCEGALPESTASLAGGPSGHALATIAWPGDLAANLGSLLVTASNGQIPSSAEALDDPVKAEVQTGQSPDTVSNDQVPGTTMSASAKDTVTTADARVQALSLPVASAGPATTSASSALTGPSSAVAKATSSVSDIVLGGGLVHIGSVQSTATATTDGTTAKVSGGTRVVDATVATIPVTIDERGVTVNGTGAAVSSLTDAVNNALSQAGLTLRVSEPQGKPVGSAVSYTSGALVAVFAPQKGYQFSVTFGGANVTADSQKSITSVTTGGTTGIVPPPTGTTGGLSSSTTGGSGGQAVVPPVMPETGTTGTSGVPAPQTLGPSTNAASTGGLYGGLSPWLGAFGLLSAGLIAAGIKRLPDRVLEAAPSACPYQES
jgi:hypothetical protein